MKHRGPNGVGVPFPGPVSMNERSNGDGSGEDSRGTGPMDEYRRRIDTMPEVRMEKVDDLRDAVESGNYHVESEKLAKKVVDETIREAVQRDRPVNR